jgi:SAM-dependent methyltransferase
MGFEYVGDELALFEDALRWKAYLGSQLAESLRGSVLEVGAGKGATTAVLCDGRQGAWTCLEPDASLALELSERRSAGRLPAEVRIVEGSLAALPEDARFDCVLYVDVLEHIEDDALELANAGRHVAPGGSLAVVSPAHQWLYSPFDRAIGHFRRYTTSSLRAIGPAELVLERLRYLDSAGIAASVANRLLLRQRMPTPGQLGFWDSRLVPISERLDPLFGYRLGKTVLGVWRRPR